MNKKQYRIDGEPATASEIIERAKSEGYSDPDGIYRTSVAADCLRASGHTVDNNPDFNEE